MTVIVASDNHDKVTAVREAIHGAFGKATVYGVASQPKNVAAQPVGFAAAKQGAKERLECIRKQTQEANEEGSILVAIENFLLEVGDDEWVDMGCLLLSDKSRDIRLCSYSQPTVVPSSVIHQLQSDTPEDYPLRWLGFSATVGSVLANKLNVPPSRWHEAVCGVSRAELLALAAKSLANSYKRALASKVDKV